jgi:multidrug efflux pump subunit AcrB
MLTLLIAAAIAAPPVVLEVAAPATESRAVADTIAGPLEKQLIGTAGVRRVSSLSSDGVCRVRLDLDPQADRGKVRSEIATRLAGKWDVRLRPDADDAVIAVAVRSDGQAGIVALTAAADRARRRLATVPQVADVEMAGAAEVGPRVALDTDKLAAFNLSAGDVLAALRPLITANRPAPPPDDLGNVTIKVGAGRPVRLQDVAVVNLGIRRLGAAGVARASGGPSPVVLLLVRPAPGAIGTVNTAVGKLLDGPGWDLPAGVTLERLAFGTGATVATLRLSAGTAPELRDRLAYDAAAAAVRAPNVRSVAWIAGPGEQVTLLVAGLGVDLSAAKVAPPSAVLRIGRLRWPLDDWPGDGAAVVARVSGDDAAAVAAAATALRDRLATLAGVTDPAVEPADRDRIAYDIDRPKAARLGLTATAVSEAIELATTGVRIGSAVVVIPGLRDAEVLRAQTLVNGQGQRVPLGTVVATRREHGPAALYREDGRPCRIVACGVRGRDVAEVRMAAREAARQLVMPGVTILVE